VAVYAVDPLIDARWDALLLQHPRARVFHTRQWLSALRETYGYKPVVLTTSAPGGRLENGVIFCDVRSWITGRRLVSLPFSDHCDPLADSPTEHTKILACVREHMLRNHCKYAELRPLSADEPEVLTAAEFRPSDKFYLHMLSLDPPQETLFRNLHKDCIQRKVRRAEREDLTYERGRSDSLLHRFYQLQLQTRRRHRLPPQPLQWFRHLIASMGDRLTIRVASKDRQPVASILTLSFKNTLTYKYGCSDEKFSHLGGTPFLFWKTIQEAKEQGMHQLDLGRSELDNPGLIAFKDRLGAKRIPLTYYRYPGRTAGEVPGGGMRQIARRILHRMPASLLSATGRVLYRHFG
jgi:hypothetical protein